jgi:MFS family permease
MDIPPTEVSVLTAGETIAAARASIFHNRRFMYLWLSQAFSQIGQNALWLGLLVLVERLSHSPTQLSFTVGALILPTVMFGILAGVLADRVSKKGIMLVSNLLRAALTLGYLLLGRTTIAINIISFTFSTVGQFFAPAEAAMIPFLVRGPQLMTANALFNLTVNITQVMGWLVTPLLIKTVGFAGFFTLLIALFVLAAGFTLGLPSDSPLHASPTGQGQVVQSVLADVREGWRILSSDPSAWLAMLHLTIIATLIPLVTVLGTTFTTGVIRAQAEDAVYLFAPAALGMFSGAAMVSRVSARVGKMNLANGALVCLGLTAMVLAAAKTGVAYLLYNVLGRAIDTSQIVIEFIPIVMSIAFFLGLEMIFVAIPAQTTLQEQCPPDFRGRIFAVQFTLSGAASIGPLLFAGALADLIGVNKTIFLTGMGILSLAVLSIRSTPANRTP